MKLKYVAAAVVATLASASSMAMTSSTFGGQHDAVESALGLYGPGVMTTSFVDIFAFTLGTAATVQSTSSALGTSFATYGLFGVGADMTGGTFDDVLFGASGLGAPGTLSVSLTAGSFYYKVSGIASAAGGGYSLGSTVTAVPEPETYAMMLAGLVAVGFLARRRQG